MSQFRLRAFATSEQQTKQQQSQQQRVESIHSKVSLFPSNLNNESNEFEKPPPPSSTTSLSMRNVASNKIRSNDENNYHFRARSPSTTIHATDENMEIIQSNDASLVQVSSANSLAKHGNSDPIQIFLSEFQDHKQEIASLKFELLEEQRTHHITRDQLEDFKSKLNKKQEEMDKMCNQIGKLERKITELGFDNKQLQDRLRDYGDQQKLLQNFDKENKEKICRMQSEYIKQIECINERITSILQVPINDQLDLFLQSATEIPTPSCNTEETEEKTV